ncbi:MAG: FadR/GntR family transcriptional regulator [Spirochaetaceae bacterium]
MEKIKAVTLVTQVTKRTMELIKNSELKPGDTLPSTAELSERFGVSRSVVREALKSLEAQSIIALTNGRRPTVRDVSLDSLAEIFAHIVRVDTSTVSEFMEIRRALEIHGAGLAAERHSEQDAERIRRLFQEMDERLYDDVDAFSYVDAEFHLAIAEATRNGMLAKLLGSIRETIQAVSREGRRLRMTPEQIAHVHDLHERLVEAILSRDSVRAGAAMADHFDAIAMSISPDRSS